MPVRRKLSVAGSRVVAMLAVLGLSAASVGIFSGLPDRTVSATGGLSGVAATGSEAHPGMMRVSWTSRPAPIIDDADFGFPLIKIDWSIKDSGAEADSAVLALFEDSPDSIVIPNLSGGHYTVSVSPVTGYSFRNPTDGDDDPDPRTRLEFELGESITADTSTAVAARPVENPCLAVEFPGLVMCGSLSGNTTGAVLSGGVFLGQGSSGLNFADQSFGWSSNDEGLATSDGVLPPRMAEWFRMRVQLTDVAGAIASQWWSAFGDSGRTFLTATDVLVPVKANTDPNSARQRVFLPVVVDNSNTTLYEGEFFKGGNSQLKREDIQRLCVQFFEGESLDEWDFAHELCAFDYRPWEENPTGGYFLTDTDADRGKWRILLKTAPGESGGYRIRFVDGPNFAPGFIFDLRQRNYLMDYATLWQGYWCGAVVEGFCTPGSSIGDAALNNGGQLNAVLQPAGRVRIDLTGVPAGYTEAGEVDENSPQDVVAYVEDTVTGRWFNAYVQKGTIVGGSATWSINVPGLIEGRQYRAFVRTFQSGNLPAQRFFLGADSGSPTVFTAQNAQAETSSVVTAQWPESFMIPYVVRVVKPNGGTYRGSQVDGAFIADPDDDICIAVIRRSDEATVASSCVSDNRLPFPSLVTLQPFPLVSGNPNSTYLAVAWKRNGLGEVGEVYQLELPRRLTPVDFVGTGFASGFYDLRALSVGVVLPRFGENVELGLPGVPTDALTVVVP